MEHINYSNIKGIKPSNQDEVILAGGLKYQVLISWKDKINKKERFGFNNDYIAFLPGKKSNEGYLWVNHEYIHPLFFSAKPNEEKTIEDVKEEMRNVGGSFFKVYKTLKTWIKNNLSINGTHIQRELKGEQYYELKTHQSRKKSISTTRTFAKETKNYNLIKEAVSNFANNCAFKLRNEKSCCSKLTVFLMTNFHKPNIKQHHPKTTLFFSTATNDSLEISSMAIKALNTIYKVNCAYKKAGVIVHQITPEKEIQISLFNKIDREKRRNLMQSVDKINIIMGRNKVRLASQGYEKKWELKQEQLSPCYTTQIKDILTIQI